ncbi:hypothetical protein [Tautonia sociabilis]|uniref:Uncharacterized protein n=1 Tax=Tautonia sociabilis TaxID=2080755 RepID=A0A432MEJ7_9BACT|nr:hypothetical protein [Tautonia sociabilis]RUL83897.1 hypothetical protein TsocGM_21465 [Tautonia sociabilis]
MATRKKSSSNNGRGVGQKDRQEQERLAARLSERADALAEHAEELADRAQHLAWQADHRFRGAVGRRPMTAVWTSFGLGLGLGLAIVALVPRDRRSGWSLDDLSGSLRELGDRVEAMGRSAARGASRQAHDLGESAVRRVRDAAGFLGL